MAKKVHIFYSHICIYKCDIDFHMDNVLLLQKKIDHSSNMSYILLHILC